MPGAGRVPTLVLALLGAVRALAADLPAIEDSIRKASQERKLTSDAKARLVDEAGALAEEITRLKERSGPGPRASRELEEAMKRFDRLAARLDDIDRRGTEERRNIASLSRRFEEAALAESSRLKGELSSGRAQEVALALEAVDEARRRVAALVEPAPGFRPVLDVSLSPGDGRTEIQQKLELLDAESERVSERIAALDEEGRVLEARASLKRQLLADLQEASRAAGPDLALIRREADDLASGLSDLAAQREALTKDRAALQRSLAQLAQKREEAAARLRSLDSKEDAR